MTTTQGLATDSLVSGIVVTVVCALVIILVVVLWAGWAVEERRRLRMARSTEPVFTVNDDGTYDLTIDGRVVEYDVDADDFLAALYRARVLGQTYQVEDQTGYRVRRTLRD